MGPSYTRLFVSVGVKALVTPPPAIMDANTNVINE
jgi:hypothetical protein